jgi:fructose-specific phosphotransferase system IIC component
MKKNLKLIAMLMITGLFLSLPSIILLLGTKALPENNGTFYYFLGNDSKISSILGAVIFGVILIAIFIIYLKLIKNSDKFQNIKSILISSFLVRISIFDLHSKYF